VILDELKVLLLEGSANSYENQLATEVYVLQGVNNFLIFSVGSINFQSKLQGFKMTDCCQDVSMKCRNSICSKTTQTDQGKGTLVINASRDTHGNLDFT
jgi:hypothetical protein